MRILVNNKGKELANSNAVISATMPKSVIAPILLGVGVQMDHTYGSKWLNDELARLGFSISSAEVYRYKQSVMPSEQTEPSTL